MKKLKIVNHEAGLFNFLKTLTKGKPSIPKDKVKEFEQFKKDILLVYKRLNNAYKIYFLGVKLKQPQNYKVEKYIDEDGLVKERKVTQEAVSKKIDFKGNWKFFLENNKTSLGQAIHAMYKFLTQLTNTKYTITEQKPAEQKPAEQKPAEQKPAEQKPAEQKEIK